MGKYWQSKENQIQFFKDFSKELNLKDLDGFYSLNKSQIEEFGGKALLELYGGSLIKVRNT